ncbi:MAG: ATP phosphoribosyltransferase regulatory subunit, partial [Candidatus Blackburnbacteria bacterium]|nr:ATP phosphoribosyltransferase regulatory subunit [Candidatus Blackburnbacteria bacterium]
DLTVPLARVVAQYQNELPIPFKRYQVGPVWRADKPQAGRYREFWQADIDTVGSSSSIADAEIIACILEAAEKLRLANVKLLISDRAFLDSLGVTPELAIVIDKRDKIGEEGVSEELARKLGTEKADTILKSLKESKEPDSIKEIRDLTERMGANSKAIVFDPWLSRGLEYYTGPIFELRGGSEKLSLGGGGRYDKLIGNFAGRELPATGFSFGIDRTVEAMADTTPPTERALVTVFNKELLLQSIKVASMLREGGINVELYPDEEAKLDKQLKYANKRGIQFVVVIGPEEAKAGTATLKNMETGEQKTVPQDKLVDTLRG